MENNIDGVNIGLDKKSLLIVSNGITPYGLHFIKRVASELHSYRLTTLYTYEFSMGNWSVSLPETINAKILGKGESAVSKLRVTSFFLALQRTVHLVREIKKANPVAVVILGYGSIPHFLILEWCKFHKLPCLLWGDSNIKGDINPFFKSWVKKTIVQRVMTRCAAVLACGSLGSQYFQKYGARPEQLFLVPNEPDYQLIENIEVDEICLLAQKYGLDKNRKRIIYSGRLVPVKRVDLLIKVFNEIADTRPDWDLLIVGGGALQQELEKSVSSNLSSRVTWTGFIDDSKAIASLYHLSDVLVLPSDYEPWALVVNEAACAGLAIVCSEVVGAAAELVRNGENGRLFKASDGDSLKLALLDVTQTQNLSNYKNNSRTLLESWRQSSDPVNGLAGALGFVLANDNLEPK